MFYEISGGQFSGGKVVSFQAEKTQGAGTNYYANGDTKSIIQNNIFLNLQGAAMNMLPGVGPSHSGTPSLVNNTIVNCNRGVLIQDVDFNVTAINNIFYGTDTAIGRLTGNTNSLTAYYNCFYSNGTNFAGYPSTYGNVVWTNRNGDPCDLGFNIFQNPLFANNQFHLSDNSWCNNAGIDSIQNSSTWYHSPEHDFGENHRPMPAKTMHDIGAWEMDYTVGIAYNPMISIPKSSKLSQNYPNPFNPVTNIEFSIPKQSNVKLIVYNSQGKEVTTLLNQSLNAGTYKVDFDGNKYSSGVYYYKLETNDFVQTRSMVLLK